MKSKSKKLCCYFKNKGGKAFIYEFRNCFRVIMDLRSEDNMRLVKKKFSRKETAINFARRNLNDSRVIRIMDRITVTLSHKDTVLDSFYPVYRREYRQSRVNGHDDTSQSYWFRMGAGKALSNTRRSFPSWVMGA
jgi:hypothetical protein